MPHRRWSVYDGLLLLLASLLFLATLALCRRNRARISGRDWLVIAACGEPAGAPAQAEE